MANSWKTYKLDNLIDVKHGYAFKGEFFSDNPTNDILLTPGNFKIGGGFKADKLKYYTGDVPEDYVLKEGDILITMTDLSKAGDTLGYSAKIPSHNKIRYLHNQRLGLVKFKTDDIDENYLYWVLRTQPYQYYIVGSATGSTVKHTSPTRICSYQFEAPSDKEEQRSIASILTSLEDKIELNLQMNQTLEAMAQAIFKEWFENFNFPGFDGKLVNGLPKSWETGALKSICSNIRNSYNPKQIEIDTQYVGLEHIPRKSIALINWGHSSEIDSQKSKFIEGDILFGKLRPYFHKVVISPFSGICSTDILVIRALKDYYQYYSLLHLSSDECIQHANAHSDGTRMPRVNWDSLSKFNIKIPPQEILVQFQNAITPIIERINNNTFENQTIIQLRDSLLPKLMSGKILIK
jgi:type I restriction enzyme S subunit